jgi:hypothetical protein
VPLQQKLAHVVGRPQQSPLSRKNRHRYRQIWTTSKAPTFMVAKVVSPSKSWSESFASNKSEASRSLPQQNSWSESFASNKSEASRILPRQNFRRIYQASDLLVNWQSAIPLYTVLSSFKSWALKLSIYERSVSSTINRLTYLRHFITPT